jgi:hypothetical protein
VGGSQKLRATHAFFLGHFRVLSIMEFGLVTLAQTRGRLDPVEGTEAISGSSFPTPHPSPICMNIKGKGFRKDELRNRSLRAPQPEGAEAAIAC